MKYFQVVAITNKGNDVAVLAAKNKLEAIKKARNLCEHEQYVPIYTKRISKKYAQFLVTVVKKD